MLLILKERSSITRNLIHPYGIDDFFNDCHNQKTINIQYSD